MIRSPMCDTVANSSVMRNRGGSYAGGASRRRMHVLAVKLVTTKGERGAWSQLRP
jgi:hypothetical protein